MPLLTICMTVVTRWSKRTARYGGGWKEQWQPEYKKNELSTWDNNQPVKGAWVEIRTLDKGDEYGKKTFRVKLRVDEMTEKNGDYARNINISFTGRDTDPMLVN